MVRVTSTTTSDAPIFVIGTAGDPRVDGFQSALAWGGKQPAILVDYLALLADPGALAAAVKRNGAEINGTVRQAFLRIESPGRDPAVLAALLARGAAQSSAAGELHTSADAIPDLIADRGRLLPARQMYYGLTSLLADALAPAGRVRPVPDLEAIRLAFDKAACHALLRAQAIPTPKGIIGITSFDHLMTAMREQRLPRVFVKQQHGSAASGMIALATSRHGLSAATTVERTTGDQGEIKLYNTRQVRYLRSRTEIMHLVDALVPYGVHVEEWVAKAGINDHTTDLRMLVVAGEPAHVVLRMSKHPMTNLHLGGTRADATVLLSRMTSEARDRVYATARKVARLFPGALQLGLDIAIATDLRRHALLEVNVFGDLLKGVLHNGLTPYQLQVQHLTRMATETVP